MLKGLMHMSVHTVAHLLCKPANQDVKACARLSVQMESDTGNEESASDAHYVSFRLGQKPRLVIKSFTFSTAVPYRSRICEKS